MSDLQFSPNGKQALLKIDGLPDIHFILTALRANREVYQAGVDRQGFYIYEQVETVEIVLTVRNIESTK